MNRSSSIPLLTFILATGSLCAAQTTPPPQPAPPAGVPLLFDVQDKSVKISSPYMNYDLVTSKGESVDLGNGIVFNSDSLKISVDSNQIKASWDSRLIVSGELSLITEQGKEVWQKELPAGGQWTLSDINSKEAPSWPTGKFHFCLHSAVSKGHVNLCTAPYMISFKEHGAELNRLRSGSDPQVIFQNEERHLKGNFEVKSNEPVQFLATLKSGASYDFLSEPSRLIIKDMVQAEETKKVVIKAELPRPLQLESELLPGESYSKLSRILGFEKTIAEKKDLWKATLPTQGASLSLPGKSGGVFFYTLDIQNPPKESERLFVTTKLTSGTYLSQDQHKVADSQGVVQVWNYTAPEKWTEGKITRDKSYLEVYRGSSGEASMRLTGVGTSEGNLLAMGEGHVAWWFNDLFGWQNDYVSKQRWGVSAKYFSSLADFPVSVGNGKTENVALNALQADIRYRLNPGLWERDETVGLIAAYEAVNLGSDRIPKLGVGVFWARSMPRSIDTWFSKIPSMNHPKWVDMELITFLKSPDSDVTLYGDFALNFHGKVLWTPTFFGEAGLGVKNYHYEFDSNGYGAKLTTFYGTLGLGINF